VCLGTVSPVRIRLYQFPDIPDTPLPAQGKCRRKIRSRSSISVWGAELLMDEDVFECVTSNFLPFEAERRLLPRRVCANPAEVDDVIQETYYKVLQMATAYVESLPASKAGLGQPGQRVLGKASVNEAAVPPTSCAGPIQAMSVGISH
jgi:hypothetical protein